MNIFKKYRSRILFRKKSIFTAIIIVVLISASSLAVVIYCRLYNTTSSPIISLEKAKPLDNGDIKIDADIQLLSHVDKDSQLFKGGDSVRFTFIIENITQHGGKFVSIDSGIPIDAVSFIRNLNGVTGYSSSDGKIRFTNVVIYPLQKQTISFDANLLHSDKSMSLNYTPSVFNESSDVIAEGKSNNYMIIGADTKDAPVTASTKQKEGQ